MPNDISAKMTIDTAEGVANVKQLGDVTEATATRMARATEMLARQKAAENRMLAEQIKLQKQAMQAANESDGGKAAGAAREAADAIGTATKAAKEFGHTNAGVMREMLVMFHEGITGNFKRMAGSTVVLAERMGGLGAAVGLLVNPFTIAAGAVGVLAAAQVQGYKASEDFRRAMILTGGAAGVTEGQFRALAQTIAAETNRSVGSAKEALQALVASGQVAPQNLAKMGTAIVQIAHLTGESSEEVAKQFEDMASDVVGWIQRHKQYADSLTAAQVEAIRQLQKADDIQGAVGLTLDAITVKTKDSATAWDSLKSAVSGAWESFTHVIGGSQTPEDALTRIDEQIAQTKARLASWRDYHGSVGERQDTDDLRRLQQQRAAQVAATTAAQVAAARRGEEQATQNAAKAARAHLDSMLEETKGAEGLREALKKLNDEFAAARKGGVPYTEEQQRELIAKVTKAHRDPTERKEDNAYQSAEKMLRDDGARLQAQIDGYVRYGRAVDETREAVMRLRLAQGGDLAGLSQSRKESLIGLAKEDDQRAKALKEAETLASVKRQVDAYRELTVAKEENAREAYITAELNAHGLSVDQQTNAALKEQARLLAESAGQRYDKQKQQSDDQAMKARAVAVDAEVDAINRQNDALHQSTLQRELAADAAKLQKQAQEELVKHEGNEAAIMAKLAIDLERVREARIRQYNDARDPRTGASNAANKWGENATDAGAAAAKMTTDSLDSITAAITRLAETGEFSFKKLWKSMADEFLQNMIRMQVAKAAGSVGSLWGSVFSALVGAETKGGGTGSGEYGDAIYAAALSGARAEGGNVNAGGTYLVGEKGPELFRAAGAGTIVPNDEMGGGSGQTIHVGQGQVINVGQGVSRAEVQQAVTQANRQTLAQVQRLSSQGKLKG